MGRPAGKKDEEYLKEGYPNVFIEMSVVNGDTMINKKVRIKNQELIFIFKLLFPLKPDGELKKIVLDFLKYVQSK